MWPYVLLLSIFKILPIKDAQFLSIHYLFRGDICSFLKPAKTKVKKNLLYHAAAFLHNLLKYFSEIHIFQLTGEAFIFN